MLPLVSSRSLLEMKGEREGNRVPMILANTMIGPSVEELDELFANRISVWKFKSYHCMVVDVAVHDVHANTGIFSEKQPAVNEEKHVEL